jgi:hypothetical protein
MLQLCLWPDCNNLPAAGAGNAVVIAVPGSAGAEKVVPTGRLVVGASPAGWITIMARVDSVIKCL